MKLKHPVLGNIELHERAPGVYATEQGHYIPFPGASPFFTNPPGPTFGQVKTGDTLRVVLAFGAKNASLPYARNVFHYVLKGLTGSPTFAAVATELLKQLFAALVSVNGNAALAKLYGSSYEFRNPTVQSLVSSTDEISGTNVQAGTNTNNQGSVPLRSAIIMHKGTAKSGRSFAGRTFWPAPDESVQGAGSLGASNTSLAQTTAEAMRALSLTAINNGAAADQSVYSDKLSKANNMIVATPVTTNTVRPVMGSQRRRQDVT